MASLSERLTIELTHRTLQHPASDIIGGTSANLNVEDGTRKLHHVQNKTKVELKIALPESGIQMLNHALGTSEQRKVVRIVQPLAHRLDGERYTCEGLCWVLKRSISAATGSRKVRRPLPMASFGFLDLNGKRSTDMWLNEVPIERIQLLTGHKSKATTEFISSSSDGSGLNRTW